MSLKRKQPCSPLAGQPMKNMPLCPILIHATRTNCTKVVRELIQHVDSPTTIWMAVMTGIQDASDEIVNILLDAKFDVNHQSAAFEGRTVLMMAVEHNRWKIAGRLIQMGALIDAQCSIGQTALMYASQSGLDEMVNLLIFYGADLNLQNHSDQTALTIAVSACNERTLRCAGYAVIRILLQQKAIITSSDIQSFLDCVAHWPINNSA